jgi:hypothetical protein
MTTLIASYSNCGCTGRCDAKCYDAVSPHCDCICQGKNHGAGRKQAVENTRTMAEKWIQAWRAGHPNDIAFEVPVWQPVMPGM